MNFITYLGLMILIPKDYNQPIINNQALKIYLKRIKTLKVIFYNINLIYLENDITESIMYKNLF